MCVYEDACAVRQIWDCLLDIWGAMCSQSRDSLSEKKNFVRIRVCECVCACADDVNKGTKYYHCIKKKIKFWFVSIIDEGVCWVRTQKKCRGDKTCYIVIYFVVIAVYSIFVFVYGGDFKQGKIIIAFRRK